MNPHTATPIRPSSSQWKVGKKSSPWYMPLLVAGFLLIVTVLLITLLVDDIATRRAVRACDTGHLTCRVSMGYSRAYVLASDAAEDQTVCGDGWRSCVDAASEGNIQ